MNKIQEFINDKFGTVRTIEIEDVVYFYGIDIAKALGYSNTSKAVLTHCKKILKKTLETSNSHNGKTVKGKVSLITKSDIYRLIVRSDLKSTDEFETWVFDEILPTIERTGAYIEDGREEEVIEKYFPSISDDVKLLMIKDLQKAVKDEQEKNKELQPVLMEYIDLSHMQLKRT